MGTSNRHMASTFHSGDRGRTSQLFKGVKPMGAKKMLYRAHEEKRVSCSEGFFARYREQGNDFLDRVVTIDETWLHHYELET